jgi:hypothetical protein
MASVGVVKEECPDCHEVELFDATTTTDHPTPFEAYPAFRGNANKRVFLCLGCRHLEVREGTPEARAAAVVQSANGRHLKAVPDA